jgi:O-antigen/teichoic acid export membrane protein
VLTFAGLGISVVIKDVVHIVTTPPFYEAYKIVPLVVLAYIIFSFYYHFSIALFVHKKTKHIAGIDAATSALNLILNYFLIKHYLAWGAVAATIASFLFRVAATYVAGIRFQMIKLEKTRIAQLLLCAFLVYWLSTLVDMGTPWLNIPLKSLFALLYILILWATGFLHESEALVLRKAWTNIGARVLLRAH